MQLTASRQNLLYRFKAGPAGRRRRRPSSAGSDMTGTEERIPVSG
jgi:hypothetical protein